ncbi:MAG TPA: pitrilysin family protein [Allosphingosinicella sp.]|jgi:zinc protease
MPIHPGKYATFLLAIVLGCACPSGAVAQPAGEAAARSAWGFDRSDLTPHPGVRFGVLSNGMRYAAMRNAVPAGGLSVRLRLAGGSALEGERELGFMHLIEHLIFHGSANIPEGALPLMLSHQGLKRWTDFNAFTSFEETVYHLDLAKADSRSRQTALTLMREISTNLVFTRKAVEGAKHKVREEIGARDALADRITRGQSTLFVPGTLVARGPVAGSPASVGRASGKALQRLYERAYVPQRATLVLVGDFDPQAVEAEIDAHFSDWPRGGEAEAEMAAAPVQAGRSGVHLLVDRKADTVVTIAAVKPLAAAGDLGGRRDSAFLEHLASEMLNRRLAGIADRADAPFRSADIAIYDYFATARLARIEVAARDRDWRRALVAGELELRRALEQGFSQAELGVQLAVSRNALARDSRPRTTPALADAIVDSAGRGIVFTQPGNPSASADYLERVRLEDVNAAFRNAWADPGRLIFTTHDRPISGGKAAIAEALRAAAATPVAQGASRF